MMKSILVAVVTVWASVQALPAKALALVISGDECAALPNRNQALEDAAGYRALFESMGFEAHFLENPTSSALRLELARFCDRIEPGDSVVFVYSGHGCWRDGALNYPQPADTPDISSTMGAATLTVPLADLRAAAFANIDTGFQYLIGPGVAQRAYRSRFGIWGLVPVRLMVTPCVRASRAAMCKRVARLTPGRGERRSKTTGA